MGIKGIYGEIGPGQRVALAKLAIDKLERTGRPLRIAIDISIWQFQIQAGKGGSNPALRTLYYRLLRLLSISVQPLFVFDGSQKPPFKRNKRTGPNSPSLTDFNTKLLLKTFGFPFHTAPGEAEAECALLQREGIVDAVLSEDVDTFMFGCGLTFRNWSSEGSRGNRPPTHVSVYDAKATKEGKSGLDCEGMVLVALMSGGDYITEGIPGCGIKVACEAARAGYGKSLCKLSKTDSVGIEKWRNDLAHEIQTNENQHFRVKHKALRIPETFPDKEVLGYYTHPVVSSAVKLMKLKEDIKWSGDVDVPALRVFVAEAFNWTHNSGTKKFIRGLAPALLVSKLRAKVDHPSSDVDDPVLIAKNEMELVKNICGRRLHFSTDGIPELHLIYHPADIVGLDIDAEVYGSEDCTREGLEPLGGYETAQLYQSGDEESSGSRSKSPTKRQTSAYDPTKPDKIWVSETVAKLGIPLHVENYEESLRNPPKPTKAKSAAKSAVITGGMRNGALDRYMTISKFGMDSQNSQMSNTPIKLPSRQPSLPLAYLAPTLGKSSASQSVMAPGNIRSLGSQPKHVVSKPNGRPASTRKDSKLKSATGNRGIGSSKPTGSSNPWTSPSSPTNQNRSHPTVHVSKSGVLNGKSFTSSQPLRTANETPNLSHSRISSPPSSPSHFRKHTHSITPPSPTQWHSQAPFSPSDKPCLPSPAKRRSLSLPTTSLRPDFLSHNSDHLHLCQWAPEPPQTPLPAENQPHQGFESHSVALNNYPHAPSSPDPDLPSPKDILSPPKKPQRISPKAHQKGKWNGRLKHRVTIISSSPAPTSTATSVPNNNDEKIPNGALQEPMQKGQGTKANQKRFVTVRESLEGSWKEVTEEDLKTANTRGRSRVWRISAIEVLDMTG